MDKLQKGQTEDKNYAFDVDRMISEGLAGGTIDSKYGDVQIDQSRDLDKEEPPNKN